MPTGGKPLALAYHSVRDVPWPDDPWGLAVAPADLVRHIRLLRRLGYSFAAFGDWAERVRAGEDSVCCLTFDDGFDDNCTTLLPILESENVPSTVFVVSTLLGAVHPDAPWARTLTPPEVIELRDAGVEIGSHAATHVDLTTMSEDEVLANLRQARAELGDLLGAPPTVLAYPFGRADEATRRAARAAGFVAACRVGDAGRWDDPLDLPRAGMNSSSTMVGLRLKRRRLYHPVVHTLPGRAARGAWRRARGLSHRRPARRPHPAS
jgi:peptidoglycan/xylan/chitin deacetylase (PgdA/CDA1 family)